MRVYKIHADKAKNAAQMNLYYVRAKSKGKARELFKALHKGVNIYSIDECSIREIEDIMVKNTPIIGVAK